MKKIWTILIVVFLSAFLFVLPVLAMGLHQDTTPPNPTIEMILQLVAGLVVTVPGFASLCVVIVNLSKMAGWVTDNNTAQVVNVYNVASALVIIVLTNFFPNVSVPILDMRFGELSKLLTPFIPVFVIGFRWLAPKIHDAIRGVPAVGYSFSLKSGKKK